MVVGSFLNNHIGCFPASVGSRAVMRVTHLPLVSANVRLAQCGPGVQSSSQKWFEGCHWDNGVQSTFSPEYSNLNSCWESQGEGGRNCSSWLAADIALKVNSAQLLSQKLRFN